MAHPLDNPARSSLLGPHAGLAERRGRVLRYPPDMTPFMGLPDDPDDEAWRDAAALVGPGGIVPLAGVTVPPPADWPIVFDLAGVQLVARTLTPAPFAEAIELGPSDVPEMLALVERTRPGPFLPRTIELGRYLGVRRDGRLVAMAGERMHPPGWTEISAVCTDASVRGQGLASRLVLAVAAGITDRGERPFLHAAATNTTAISLYETLGFAVRRRITFAAAKVPTFPSDPVGKGFRPG